jgi:general secretion pathway protein N
MKRTIWISLLAIVGFAIILLIRLPASWLLGYLPPNVQCAEVSGTAWEGSCGSVAYNGAALGNLSWELHPSALLRAKLGGFVNLARGQDFVRGDFEIGAGGVYTAKDLQAQLPLDPPLVPELNTGFSGNVSINLVSARFEKGAVAALEGQVQATSLYSKRDRMALGSYSASFPNAAPGSEPVGQVMSLEGPVDFQGTLKLTRAPGWAVDGKVRVKPETPPELAQQLAYLGRPDADGTRPLSLEGTF